MSETCRHPPTPRTANRPLADDIARARDLCAERGERWTAPRHRVYELLLKADGPVKAYDLMDRYADGRAAKPPTVYRALEFLESQGLVHRIASLNAFTACGADGHDRGACFLICDCCGGAEEFELDLAQTVAATAVAHGFKVAATTVELRGSCRRCSA